MSASDKNARYDRQLRLWGEGGQQKLEASRLLLINGTATGTEILKNLVLPGVGSFTILDGARVEEADLGRNFFVTLDSLGKPRAQVTTELLKELNNFVEGDFLAEVCKMSISLPWNADQVPQLLFVLHVLVRVTPSSFLNP
jgi:amyloid beta precursor protein binding protein 1